MSMRGDPKPNLPTSWWESGDICEDCGIRYCSRHKPGQENRLVWLASSPTVYHLTAWCAAAPDDAALMETSVGGEVHVVNDESQYRRGTIIGDEEEVLRPAMSSGWYRVTLSEAKAKALPCCLRCQRLVATYPELLEQAP